MGVMDDELSPLVLVDADGALRAAQEAHAVIVEGRDLGLPMGVSIAVEGTVSVGKTTCHELACGVHSAPAADPWNALRLPGGSSGCSGIAVASGVVSMALGSDTGGSIGIPAIVVLLGAACESATNRHHRRPSFYMEVAI